MESAKGLYGAKWVMVDVRERTMYRDSSDSSSPMPLWCWVLAVLVVVLVGMSAYSAITDSKTLEVEIGKGIGLLNNGDRLIPIASGNNLYVRIPQGGLVPRSGTVIEVVNEYPLPFMIRGVMGKVSWYRPAD